MTLFEQFHVHILKPVAVEWDTSAELEADDVFDSQELAAVLEVAAYRYLNDPGIRPSGTLPRRRGDVGGAQH